MKLYRPPTQLLAPIFLALLILVIQSRPAAQTQQNLAAVPGKSTAQYVGIDVCKTCHEDLYKKNFETTPHFKTTLEGGHGCESCHGPGSEHVEAGGDVSKIIRFSTLSKDEVNKRCLSCHGDNPKQKH